MKFKKIMLITLLLLAVLTISSVSANDNLTDANEEVKDASFDEIELSGDDMVSSLQDEIIKETDNGTFTALQNKIDEAEEGSTVTLENDYAYDDGFSANGINISKSLTVDGQGYVIDASSQARAFYITGSNVVLKNITIKNGYTSNNGGAILISEASNCTISNSIFLFNTAGDGGAVNGFCSVNCNIENCAFMYNNATYGGAISWDCEDIALDDGDNIKISDCIFTDNNASETAGAVHLYYCYNCNVSDCEFINNSASDYAGALELDSVNNALISNCNFEDNSAEIGGAIDMTSSDYCEILYSNFTYNYADNTGAAIQWWGDDGEISGCVFINNSADNGSAIYADSGNYCEISDCIFTMNVADDEGTVYLNRINVTFSDCSFTANFAENGGAISAYYNFEIEGCEFTNNTVTENGGAIYSDNISLTVTGCNFTNNIVYTDNYYGGAIYFEGDELIIADSKFISNKAYDCGAVSVTSSVTEITNTEFIENEAYDDYGALIISGGNVLIDNCTFNSNYANGSVAAVSLDSNVTVNNTIFRGNRAKDSGALFYGNFKNNTLIIDQCQFIDNNCTGAYLYSYHVRILNSKFENSTSENGVAIYNSALNELYLSNNTINTDEAEIFSVYGGKIISNVNVTILDNKTLYKHVNDTVLVYLTFCDDNGNLIQVQDFDLYVNNTQINYIYNNSTQQYEANYTANETGLYNINITDVHLSNLTFKNCELIIVNVTDDLSTLQKLIGNADTTLTLTKDYTFNPLTDVDLISGVVINKTIVIDGAGFTINGNNQARIFNIESDNVTIKNITFINGTSSYYGGAVNWNGNNGELADCIFINNHANNGGAIYCYNGDVVISNSNFTSNNANYIAGAIFANSTVEIDNCNFEENTADFVAGAVLLLNNSKISNSRFTNNTAERGGAIAAANSNISNSNFTANTATEDGGAIFAANNITITNCLFKENTAEDEGGAIKYNQVNENATLNINESTFTENTAESGGALSINGTVTISNSNFTDNTAKDGSDNIVAVSSANVTLDNVSPENLTVKTYVELVAWTLSVKYGNTVQIRAIVMKDNETLNEGSAYVIINNQTYTADVADGIATIQIPGLDAGSYNNIKVTYNGSDNYTNSFNTVSFNVLKLDTTITAGAKTYIINYGGKYSITLKDENGTTVAGKTVTLTINGKNYKATTGSNGIATFTLTKAILKSAGTKTATIKFTGDTNYYASNATAKITVKKESVKILKAKKTYKFKKSAKTKNLRIILKNSKNKAMKKVKVTLKLTGKKIRGKKTITAKTNSKGVVTFKLAKKLTRKTKVKYAITYKASSYYNKAVKKGTIQIR